MTTSKPASAAWIQRVVFLSLLLFFFSVPHVLEDFASGEPAKAGAPAPVLALVISIFIALQALGLYWLGQGKRGGLSIHAGLGLFWPLASGVAQLPVILSGVPYRSGFISVFYVVGLMVVGLLLCLVSVLALRNVPGKG